MIVLTLDDLDEVEWPELAELELERWRWVREACWPAGEQ